MDVHELALPFLLIHIGSENDCENMHEDMRGEGGSGKTTREFLMKSTNNKRQFLFSNVFFPISFLLELNFHVKTRVVRLKLQKLMLFL